MSKKVVNKKYELLVILKQDLGESQVKETQDKFSTLIRSEGGVSISVNNLSKRQMSYPMKKNRYGHYMVFNFESSKSDTVANISSVLRITDSVLKFEPHRIPDAARKFKGNPKRTQVIDLNDDILDPVDEY
jgi:small subunit ribosomal protein S6